jgi:hypothetical protein
MKKDHGTSVIPSPECFRMYTFGAGIAHSAQRPDDELDDPGVGVQFPDGARVFFSSPQVIDRL